MKRDHRGIEDLLRDSRPAEVPQMAAALGRVWNQIEQAGGRVPEDGSQSVQQRFPSEHQRAWTFLPRTVAAVLVIGAAIGIAVVWPHGVRAYAAGNEGLQVTLADDSRVEMRAHSEMSVGPASDGLQIDLKKGDIIVTAADHRGRHLSVRTKDMTATVDGTIALVNAAEDGSRVGVIKGEARVREGATETRVRPGEQVSTRPTIAGPSVAEGILWSRNASSHLAILDSFMKGLTTTAGTLAPVASPRRRGAAVRQAPSAEFEEASIHECDPDNLPKNVPGVRGGGGASSFYMTPGRTYALCMTAATLIRTAYGYAPVGAELDGRTTDPASPARFRRPLGDGNVAGLPVEDGRRVRGGPDWVRTTKYTIEAVADGPADAATMSRPMLLALLEKRFKLKAHVDSEPVPAFALVVAPGGLKIKPAEPDSCIPVPVPPDRGPRFRNEAPHILPYFTGRSLLSEFRQGEKPFCGQALERHGPNQVFVAGGSTLSDLAQLLGMRFLGPVRVYDRTGITHTFNWALEFTPEEGNRSPPGRGDSPAESANVPPAPTAFVALQQQLGLRLEPMQAPREFVVIDSIDRPTPN